MRFALGVALLAGLAGAVGAAEQPQPTPPVVVSLKVAPEPAPAGQKLTLQVTMTNRTDQDVVLDFNTGQRFDVQVLQDKREVWRWSHDRFFTMALGRLTLKAGASQTYTTPWDQKDNDGNAVAPGTYSAVGIIASRPRLQSPPVTLHIEAAKP